MTQLIHKSTCARMVAHVVQDMVLTQEIPSKGGARKTLSLTRFDNPFESENIPKLSIEDYIDRLGEYLHVSSSCFVLALIYIDRITKNTEVTLSQQSVHRLLTTSILLAMKFHDDLRVEDAFYISTVVGIPSKEMKLLETTFASMVDYNLFVHPSTFKEYCQFLLLCSHEAQFIQQKEFKIIVKKRIASMGGCSCGSPEHSTRSPELHNRRRKGKKLGTNKRKLLKKGKSQNLDLKKDPKRHFITKSSFSGDFKESPSKECHEESTQDSRDGSFVDTASQSKT